MKIFPGCGCQNKAEKMNRWGPEGCREHREEIKQWLIDAASKRSWGEKFKAGLFLMKQPWFNPMDPYGSIVDECIRRAELEKPTDQTS